MVWLQLNRPFALRHRDHDRLLSPAISETLAIGHEPVQLRETADLRRQRFAWYGIYTGCLTQCRSPQHILLYEEILQVALYSCKWQSIIYMLTLSFIIRNRVRQPMLLHVIIPTRQQPILIHIERVRHLNELASTVTVHTPTVPGVAVVWSLTYRRGENERVVHHQREVFHVRKVK